MAETGCCFCCVPERWQMFLKGFEATQEVAAEATEVGGHGEIHKVRWVGLVGLGLMYDVIPMLIVIF